MTHRLDAGRAPSPLHMHVRPLDVGMQAGHAGAAPFHGPPRVVHGRITSAAKYSIICFTFPWFRHHECCRACLREYCSIERCAMSHWEGHATATLAMRPKAQAGLGLAARQLAARQPTLSDSP